MWNQQFTTNHNKPPECATYGWSVKHTVHDAERLKESKHLRWKLTQHHAYYIYIYMHIYYIYIYAHTMLYNKLHYLESIKPHQLNLPYWSPALALHPAYLLSHGCLSQADPLSHSRKTCWKYNPQLTLSCLFESAGIKSRMISVLRVSGHV